MIGLIYKVTNIESNKCYIGQTCGLLKDRKKEHLRKCKNAHSIFANALRGYGPSKFKWEIIGYCETKDELDEAEKCCIEFFQSRNRIYGYNITFGGEGGDTLSNNPNIHKIKHKMKIAHLGKKAYQYRHDIEENIDEIISLNQNGYSAKEIAKKFNCSSKAIRNHIPNYKNSSSKPRHNYQYRDDIDSKKIIELRNSGMTYSQLAKMFNCSIKVITNRLKEGSDAKTK